MSVRIPAMIGSCAQIPNADACRTNITPSPIEQVATALGGAISGDSIVRFGKRLSLLAQLRQGVTGISAERAMDFQRVPRNNIWFIVRISHVWNQVSTNFPESLIMAMPPNKERKFNNLTSIILPGNNMFNETEAADGIVVTGRATSSADVIDYASNLAADVTINKFQPPFVLPSEWFLRHIITAAATGSVTNMIVSSIFGVSVNINEIETNTGLNTEFTSKSQFSSQIDKSQIPVSVAKKSLIQQISDCFTCPKCGKLHSNKRNGNGS